MDAFAISVTNGLTLKDFRIRHALWMGLYFGGFQFLMPLIGYFLGSAVSGYVIALGPYISFALLAFIGGKMLFDSLRPGQDEAVGMQLLSHKRLLAMAVATSIDALAVGVTLAFQPVNILLSAGVIGVVAFALAMLGGLLGRRLGELFQRRATILGGLVLIGIGLKILFEHLA